MSDCTPSSFNALSPDNEPIRIPLGYDTFALIDAEDAVTVVQWRWRRQVQTHSQKIYVMGHRTIGGVREDTYLHRLLMQPGEGMDVDHINGDTLDCRRVNMRICTEQQNTFNRRKKRTSKNLYIGVYQDPRLPHRWYARIKHDDRIIYLGGHATPEDAARAYDNAAKELRGEFARLNFPDAESEAA